MLQDTTQVLQDTQLQGDNLNPVQHSEKQDQNNDEESQNEQGKEKGSNEESKVQGAATELTESEEYGVNLEEWSDLSLCEKIAKLKKTIKRKLRSNYLYIYMRIHNIYIYICIYTTSMSNNIFIIHVFIFKQ